MELSVRQLDFLDTLPPGKELPVPVSIGQEAGWAPPPVWTWWQREK